MTFPVIADYPAYAIVEAPAYLKFKHGMQIALPIQSRRGDTLWYFYTLGSIFGFAVSYGDDVLKTYEQAKERGHKLFWANANAISITAHQRAKETVFGFNWGDIIPFEGKRFRLDKAANNNVELVEVGEDA